MSLVNYRHLNSGKLHSHENAIGNLCLLMWESEHEQLLSKNTGYSLEQVELGSLFLKHTWRMVTVVAFGEGNRVVGGPERKRYFLNFFGFFSFVFLSNIYTQHVA